MSYTTNEEDFSGQDTPQRQEPARDRFKVMRELWVFKAFRAEGEEQASEAPSIPGMKALSYECFERLSAQGADFIRTLFRKGLDYTFPYEKSKLREVEHFMNRDGQSGGEELVNAAKEFHGSVNSNIRTIAVWLPLAFTISFTTLCGILFFSAVSTKIALIVTACTFAALIVSYLWLAREFHKTVEMSYKDFQIFFNMVLTEFQKTYLQAKDRYRHLHERLPAGSALPAVEKLSGQASLGWFGCIVKFSHVEEILTISLVRNYFSSIIWGWAGLAAAVCLLLLSFSGLTAAFLELEITWRHAILVAPSLFVLLPSLLLSFKNSRKPYIRKLNANLMESVKKQVNVDGIVEDFDKMGVKDHLAYLGMQNPFRGGGGPGPDLLLP